MKRILLVAFILFTCFVSAQLSPFNLTLTKSDETCLGNGTIAISATGLTAQSTMLYKIYRLPDTASPIAVISNAQVNGLTAGTYRVVAFQYLNNLSNSQQAEVTIESLIAPFDIEVTSSHLNCSAGGNITVNSLTGTAVQFEIISGPVTAALQTSNVFNNLPSGVYNVRAYNECGVAKVKTYTINIVSSSLAISDAIFPVNVSQVCNDITVNNIVSATTGAIGYPITAKHTLTPINLGGQPVIINQTYNSGAPDVLEVSAVMPRYAQDYTYDLQVTDNCNNVYQKQSIIVDVDVRLSLSTGNSPCGNKFINLSLLGYMPPFSVQFVTAPTGFVPSSYNNSSLGPFSDSAISYGGIDNPVPFGLYTIAVTDACGRQDTKTIDVQPEPLIPSVKGTNNGCFSQFGRIRISIPNQKVITATIIAAPAAYTQPLPKNVTANINSAGVLTLNNMPLGTYKIAFTDDCGYTYTRDVEVPPYVEKPFTISALPGCGTGYGSVRYKSGNGDLANVKIVDAPLNFGQTLPYDVSLNIDSEGDFYMNNLPEGNYTFMGTDVCNVTKMTTVSVAGYNLPQNSYTYTPNCASFSVKVTDTGNGTEGASYWLQRYDEATGTWEHPNTGVAYPEGTVPAADSGVKLTNNQIKSNLNYHGKFRILKKFEYFSNGSAQNALCFNVLGEFEYQEGLGISSAYSLSCIGDPASVRLDVTGYPSIYRIKEKNGQSFIVNNGNNPVFSNLEPAQYLFEVEDTCGNIVNKLFDVQLMPSIADASRPMDMIVCNEQGVSSLAGYTYHLTDQNASVLGPLYSSMYSVSYHLTQADADAGINALPEYYTSTSNGQTIYVRLIHNEIAICHGTTSFRLFVSEVPQPTISTRGIICDGQPITLRADHGYDSYEWSTGERTEYITVTEPGDYYVIVTKNHGTAVCTGREDVTLKSSVTPKIVRIETSDWTSDQNSITVETDGAAKYLYSLDGENYQEENFFENLEPGVYKVYVKDDEGCGLDMKEIVLMNYPKFFTPNADGQNDKWHIKYSILEPHMKIAIYDRYGKMITSFNSKSDGWDGTMNGQQLPSTDYWFVVTREDGRELRGHFAMLR